MGPGELVITCPSLVSFHTVELDFGPPIVMDLGLVKDPFTEVLVLGRVEGK